MLKLSVSSSNVLLLGLGPVVTKLCRQLVEVSLRYVRDSQEVFAKARIQARDRQGRGSLTV